MKAESQGHLRALLRSPEPALVDQGVELARSIAGPDPRAIACLMLDCGDPWQALVALEHTPLPEDALRLLACAVVARAADHESARGLRRDLRLEQAVAVVREVVTGQRPRSDLALATPLASAAAEDGLWAAEGGCVLSSDRAWLAAKDAFGALSLASGSEQDSAPADLCEMLREIIAPPLQRARARLLRLLQIHAIQKNTEPSAMHEQLLQMFRAHPGQAIELARMRPFRGAKVWLGGWSGHDADGVRLPGARLLRMRRVKMRRSDLRGALLRSGLEYCDLSRSDLRWLSARGMDLGSSILEGADLREACLLLADLSQARLSGADLRGACLRRARLRGADLTGADLRGADMRQIDLSGADLTGARLDGARLTGIVDASTRLDAPAAWMLPLHPGASLRGRRLDQSVMRTRRMTHIRLRGADLRGAFVHRLDLTCVDLTDADLSGAVFSEVTLVGAQLRGVTSRGLTLHRVDLSGVELPPGWPPQ